MLMHALCIYPSPNRIWAIGSTYYTTNQKSKVQSECLNPKLHICGHHDTLLCECDNDTFPFTRTKNLILFLNYCG